MSFNPFNSASQAGNQVAFDQGLRAHMMRVFNYMGLGLAVTGLVAYAIASSPQILAMFFDPVRGGPTVLGLIAIFSPLAFILFFSFAAMRSSLSTLQLMFWAFCGVMGISMASVFIIYTGASIASTFFVTAGMFFATSLYGYTTKTDLSKMGSFMIMGLIGIVIASLVNMFLHSSGLNFAISILGVVIFTGLTAWDMQRIKESYSESYGVESNGKMALFGALSLYMNFVNLFQFMLQFMGSRRN